MLFSCHAMLLFSLLESPTLFDCLLLHPPLVQDHLVKTSSQALASHSHDDLEPSVEDSAAVGAEYWSTKGQASKAVRVVLASNRFMKAGSLRLQRSLSTGVENGEGEDGCQNSTGPAGAVSQQQ